MAEMFRVRSPRPSAGPFPARSLRSRPRAHNVRPLTSWPSASRALPSSLATRQDCDFNQPLGIDTSSVTTMSHMFAVRALASTRPPFPCTRLAQHSAHCSPSQHLTCTPCARPCDTPVLEFQPAVEPRHPTRHRHVLHVQCARARLDLQPGPFPACTELARSPRAHTGRPLTCSRASPLRLDSTPSTSTNR